MPTFEARPLASVQPRRADRAAVRQTTSSHTILGSRATARHPILLLLALLIGGAGCHSDPPSPGQPSNPARSPRPPLPTPSTTTLARVPRVGHSPRAPARSP